MASTTWSAQACLRFIVTRLASPHESGSKLPHSKIRHRNFGKQHLDIEARGILQHSKWDALLVALAALHGAVVLLAPAAPIIALGVWWSSNTISHNFIHKPFFRARTLNRIFSLYLSVLLAIPQSIWRDRHFAHHAGAGWRLRISSPMVLEVILVISLWGTLLALEPKFFLTAYLPGYLLGVGLCALHGHYEHARGTVSHYGALYNLPFFNDGYHVEHHAYPGTHWRRLPERAAPGSQTSRWPSVLRWLDALTLESLEKWVLRSELLQRFVLDRHRQAFRALLPKLRKVRKVGIVGGALFPRTALILRELLPDTQLVVIDLNAENLRRARAFVNQEICFVNDRYHPTLHNGFDLVVIPLSFVGDRAAIYRQPPAPAVVVHDWIWRKRGTSAIVSRLLLKRLNLVKR